jgi:hypothetical protein
MRSMPWGNPARHVVGGRRRGAAAARAFAGDGHVGKVVEI